MDAKSNSVENLLLSLKRDLLAALAEYLGTTLFLLMGLGGIQASATSVKAARDAQRGTVVSEVASVEQLLYVSTSMALALLASAWTFFRISGSVFNPNIAIALVMTGALKPLRFFLYVMAEILAGITACGILSGILPGALAVDCGLGANTKVWQGLVIEVILTGALTLTVLFLAVEKHHATPFAPVGIGLVLFTTHLFGVPYTGAAMNSARAFGPEVIVGFKPYHWIYWIGPSLGSFIAALIYLFLKSVDYDSLNPKQDSVEMEDSPDLQGIEVKMRRRTTHYDLEDSKHHMPSNFGMATGPLPPVSIYRARMSDAGRPASPMQYETPGLQSPIVQPGSSIRPAPSLNESNQVTSSNKLALNHKGFITNTAHIEHREDVNGNEVISPRTSTNRFEYLSKAY